MNQHAAPLAETGNALVVTKADPLGNGAARAIEFRTVRVIRL
ncbi:MAG TPA: hypothetical protein VLI93_13545 [Acetobacteraceae bacterium]|nr:hypothetical protein [Acetobacteraceae bacterium]